MQGRFVKKLRAYHTFPHMPDVAEVDAGGLHAQFVVGIDEASDFIEQAIGNADPWQQSNASRSPTTD
jgi:hypothetical protein